MSWNAASAYLLPLCQRYLVLVTGVVTINIRAFYEATCLARPIGEKKPFSGTKGIYQNSSKPKTDLEHSTSKPNQLLQQIST